jgi:hypothetical protein
MRLVTAQLRSGGRSPVGEEQHGAGADVERFLGVEDLHYLAVQGAAGEQ